MSVKVTFMTITTLGKNITRTFDNAEDWGFNEVRHLIIYDSNDLVNRKHIAEIVTNVQSVEFV
ncbi:hypothetical protein LCGC14_2419400 [marine sediment metagenome]|uniref:Uncharacterized protein n=1 Tax=marine sediment metagenome TaxID=412755 RepID=A0A0F9EJG4_9ZZZZ